MRPTPAIIAAPPFAVHRFANDAVGADIVGTDAIVGLDAVGPRFQIVRDPMLITVVAGVEEGVGDQAGAGEIERDVTAHLPLVEGIQDHCIDCIIVPVGLGHHLALEVLHFCGHVEVVKWHRIFGQHPAMGCPVFLRIFEAGPFAAGDGRADHALFSIPIVRSRIVARVETGKAQRAGTIRFPLRVGQAEVVEVDGRFAVVHPVVIGVKFTLDLSIVGELLASRLPTVRGCVVQVGVAARAHRRGASCDSSHSHHPSHPCPAIFAPYKGAVLACVAFLIEWRRLIHHVDQVALA